ncbi:hypothetical protein [Pedobacter ghigonis]|uniref:hypothetical protein n=1 Tax=Pedobacter ghigonis TaxID=2730403 RepID=UPI00158F60C7|nr:hypothetical protein [Pedobacter ghigonis]
MKTTKNIIYSLLIILILLLITHYRHIASAMVYDSNETKSVRSKLRGEWILVKKQGFADNSKTEDLRELTYFKYFVSGSKDFIPEPYLIKAYDSTATKWFRNRVFFIGSDKEAQRTSEIIRLTKDSLIIGDRDSQTVNGKAKIPMRSIYLRKNN